MPFMSALPKTMHRGRAMKNRSGFSLIELTVALAIIGGLAAVAAPRVYEATDYNDVLTVKRTVVTHFASAQSTAVQRGRQVKVNIAADSIWISVVTAATDSAITPKRSLVDIGANVESSLAQVTYDSRGFAVGMPLAGALVRIHGMSASDSVCVTRSGMVLQRGCI